MKKRITAGLLACALLGSTPAAAFASEASAWEPVLIASCEAENGSMTGRVHAENDYAVGFENDGDSCSVEIDIPADGFYDLEFTTMGLGGYKQNYVSADGEQLGTIESDSSYSVSAIRRVYLTAGTHTITVSKYWGYIRWDSLRVLTSQPFDESIFEVSPKLCDPDAIDNAKRLFSYLCDQYGKTILSGQYCDSGMNGWEILKMAEKNGNLHPAILGVDLGYYSQTGVDHNASVKSTEQAITCWDKGGIVTACWHWLAPEKYITGTWYAAFRPEHVDLDLAAVMDGKDPEGLALLDKDIGNIAAQLLKLQEAGVPVLWRPLHEAGGGWFWWGAAGSEAYKKLYIRIYEKLTGEYGVHNLIWVWNGQDPDWYPGDEYVDIVGVDIYAGEHVYTSQIEAFLKTHESTGGSNKMVVLSENGTMIDPELSVRDRAMFGFFCTWSGEFVMNNGLKKSYSEQYTEIDMLRKVYASPYVITREELPDLKTYPIRDE